MSANHNELITDWNYSDASSTISDDSNGSGYAVIVHNAEIDFSTIHRHGLTSCISNVLKESNLPVELDNVTVRTEVRSAQIELKCLDPSDSMDTYKGKLLKCLNPTLYLGKYNQFRVVNETNRNKHTREGFDTEDGNVTVTPTIHQLVGAQAVTSKDISAVDLNKELSVLNGFEFLYKCHSRHYFLVFTSKEALYKAKSILDTFEPSSIHITITIPRRMEQEFNKYIDSITDA